MSSSGQSQAPPATATQNPPATAANSASQPPTEDAKNGTPSKPKGPKNDQKGKQPQKPKASDAPATAADGSSEKLTPAEMKKKQKAEKAARRAREKLEREGGGAGGGQQAAAQGGPVQTPRRPQQGGRDGPVSTPRGLKYPGGPRAAVPAPTEIKKKEDKNVAVFGHLYGIPRRSTIAGAAKEVHPAVLALGLQIRDYVICGSSARCVATLIAFKRVCQACLSE